MNRRYGGQRTPFRQWFSLKKMGFWSMILIGALLPGSGCSMTDSETKREPLVGGPCEYRSYPGQAEIVSVVPMGTPSRDGERFDVKFRFLPDRPVEEPHGRAALERTFTLRDREMSPDRAFIEQFDIRPGKRFNGMLKVITRGACTPILFDFPSLAPGGAAPR